MNSALELELAHDGAIRCADVLKRLLTPAIFYAEAGFVCPREGTSGDTADHLAEDIAEARIYVRIDKSAIAVCNVALTLANKSLTPAGTRAGLRVGEIHFCHAHEAIVETLALVALHYKAFSEELDEPHVVGDDTINIEILRANLEDACESITHEPYFLTHENIELLVRDVRQEFAEAIGSVAPPASDDTRPSADEVVVEDANERRNGKWSKVHDLLDNESDSDSWTDDRRRQKVAQWNNDHNLGLTTKKLGELIRDRRKRSKSDN